MRLTTHDIVRLVSAHTGISTQDIVGPAKFKPLAHARFAVSYLARERGYSLPQIGKRLNRDHTTIMHAVMRAKELAARNPEYAVMLAKVAKGEWPDGKRLTYIPAVAPTREYVAFKAAARPAPAADEKDASHLFHKQVAKGSDALLAALRNAA